MKKNILSKVIMAAAILFTVSCKKDLLDQPPYGVQTDESFYKTSDDLNKTLTATYSYLNVSGFPPPHAALWAIGDVGTDDAHKGGGPSTNQPGIYELSIAQQKTTNNIINLYWGEFVRHDRRCQSCY